MFGAAFLLPFGITPFASTQALGERFFNMTASEAAPVLYGILCDGTHGISFDSISPFVCFFLLDLRRSVCISFISFLKLFSDQKKGGALSCIG